MKRILGLDISSSVVGYAVLNKQEPYYVVSGHIILPKTMEQAEKMVYMYEELKKVIQSYKVPDMICVLERPIFFVGRFSSAKSVAVCHTFWGVVRLLLQQENIITIDQHPATTKSNLGLTKKHKHKIPIHNIVHGLLPELWEITSEDELDALGLAISQHFELLNKIK